MERTLCYCCAVASYLKHAHCFDQLYFVSLRSIWCIPWHGSPGPDRYITQQGHKLEVGAPRPPATVTNAVSWRSEGIRYRKNEVFMDVIESVNLLVRGVFMIPWRSVEALRGSKAAKRIKKTTMDTDLSWLKQDRWPIPWTKLAYYTPSFIFALTTLFTQQE